MGNWYSVGHESEQVKAEEKRAETRYGPRRFWLKAGESKNVVFIDDSPFSFQEFQFRKDGSWQNWVTSPGPDSPVYAHLVKELGDSYLVGMYTVVQCTPYTDKDNKEHNYGLEVFPSKGKTIREKMKIKATTLKDKITTVLRATEKTVNHGDDFTPVKAVEDPDALFAKVNYKGKLLSEMFDAAERDPEKMKALKRIFNVQINDGKLVRRVPAFNYHEIYAPLSADDIRARIAGHDTPSDRRGGDSKSADDKANGSQPLKADDIPF